MRIRVVRESGGLGDVVRLWPVFDGLKRKYPEAEIHFWGLEEYRVMVKTFCRSVDKFIVCPRDARRQRNTPLDERRHRYLARGIQYDLEFDLYCPAWVHEAETRGSVTKDRVELFCESVGVEPGPVRFVLGDEHREAGLAWARSLPCEPEQIVAVQPYSTHRARNWHDAGWLALLPLLVSEGFYPVLFDYCGRVKRIGGHLDTRNSHVELASKLWACNHLVGIDSGLFHVAGAVGTPALMIVGATSGPILCRPYPRATWITGPVPATAPNKCQTPCYTFSELGYAASCQTEGCRVAQAVRAEDVLAALLATYAPKAEYCGDASCTEETKSGPAGAHDGLSPGVPAATGDGIFSPGHPKAATSVATPTHDGKGRK